MLRDLVLGKSLILYIAAQERSLRALQNQEEEKGKERALYSLSRTLIGVEVNYSFIKNMCLALFFAIEKFRHYMQAFTVHLVAKADPIKYLLFRPIISRRLAKWTILLQQYDIVYIPKKAIEGQVLTNFLANHPIPSDWKLCEDLPDDECLGFRVTTSHLIDEQDWCQRIIEYLEHGKIPKDSLHKTEIRRRATHFICYKGNLYLVLLKGSSFDTLERKSR